MQLSPEHKQKNEEGSPAGEPTKEEQRVLLNPDCGFATFADNPITSADVATQKLAAMVAAARTLRRRHHLD